MKKYILNTILVFVVTASSVVAQSLWTNNEEGFAARFPSNPSKVKATASGGSGYAFQSTKQFSNGAALFAVTIVEQIPSRFQTEKLKNYIEESNNEFIKSMGVNPTNAQTKWTKFGDRRPQLNYDFSLQYKGANLKAKGFWVVDKSRILRISVTYTGKLLKGEIKNITDFLDTFIIIEE